jgi:hypothetical protein
MVTTALNLIPQRVNETSVLIFFEQALAFLKMNCFTPLVCYGYLEYLSFWSFSVVTPIFFNRLMGLFFERFSA